MTNQVIRIKRREGLKIAPRGVSFFYPQGDYQVPDQMPVEHSRLAIEGGVGVVVRSQPETKATKSKRKAKKKKTGKPSR